MIFRKVRRAPCGSRAILNTRAPKPSGRFGSAVSSERPRKNSSTPVSFKAEPNQQGKTVRRAMSCRASSVLTVWIGSAPNPFKLLGKLRAVRAEVDAALGKLRFQLMQQRFAVRSIDVHFVDEEKRRDLIPAQKLPERVGMPLHAAGAAHD